MNPLLILREEIVCLVILLFLLVNALAYQTGRDSGSFLRLALCAVGHVACEILVVLAMNPPGRVGAGANRLFHAFFYLFAVLFAYEFFCCTVRLGFASRAAVRRARRWGLPAVLLYAAALPFLPLYYLKGNGIHYGMGPFIVVSFAVAMLYFAASAVILFLRRRRMPRQVKLALLPLTVGIGYELIKFCGRHDNLLTKIISAPGMWLQHITVHEPDDSMIEVAIAAVTPVLPEKQEDARW